MSKKMGDTTRKKNQWVRQHSFLGKEKENEF